MNETAEQLKRISKIIDTSKIMTNEDLKNLLTGIVHILALNKNDISEMNEAGRQTTLAVLERMVDKHEDHAKSVDKSVDEKNGTHAQEMKRLVEEVTKALALVKDKIAKDGKDGKSPKIEDIVPEVMKAIQLPQYEIETAGATADRLETLEGEDRLKASAIEENSLLELIKRILPFDFSIGNPQRVNTVGGGVQSITSKDGSVTIKSSGAKGKGVVDLSASGGSGGFNNVNEIVSGSGTAFTLANTPLNGAKVCLYGGGSRLTPGAGKDYTISGKNITMSNSYATGQVLADYSS